MNQVKNSLYLNKDKHQIIIGSHARERIAERLSWSKKVYMETIEEICFDFWEEIINNDTEAFHIISKGVKWIFETRGSNRVVLMTVVLYNEHPAHAKVRKLISKFCCTGEKDLRKKLKQQIIETDKKAPKLITSIDSNNRKVHSTFNFYRERKEDVE